MRNGDALSPLYSSGGSTILSPQTFVLCRCFWLHVLLYPVSRVYQYTL